MTDLGPFQGTIVGLVGLGSADSFGGAQLVAMDLDTALERLDSEGKVDVIDVSVVEGADVATVQAAITEVLPPQYEVVTGEQVADETADSVNEFVNVFGTGLLIFAFITAFVSAFIINNVFQITIGQRLRELALLRAVGASGRQVRRMITLEAFGLGVIATVLGIGGGVLVATRPRRRVRRRRGRLPRHLARCSHRARSSSRQLVGIGITMVSVIVPSRACRPHPTGGRDAARARIRRDADEATRGRRRGHR